MNLKIKSLLVLCAIVCASLGAPKKSEAAIGVISLIGGPAGIVLIEVGAGLMIGGSAAVIGTCYVGQKVADWSDDCPIFMNLTFWPGLAILGSDAPSANNQIALDLVDKYNADPISANRIADRIYNKALKASKKAALGHGLIEENQRLMVSTKVSLSEAELRDLATTEFSITEGFNQLVMDYN